MAKLDESDWQELRSFGISKYSKGYSPFSLKNGWFVSIVSVDNRNNMLHSICTGYHGGWCIVAYVTDGFVRGRQQASGEAARMRRNNEKPTRCSAAHFRRFLAHIFMASSIIVVATFLIFVALLLVIAALLLLFLVSTLILVGSP